jgi:hypothetical protein
MGESFGFVSPQLAYLPSSAVYDGGLVPNFTVAVPTVADSPGYGALVAASLFMALLFRIRAGIEARAPAGP